MTDETKEQIRILFLSNHPNFVSGYSKVTREICGRLAQNSDFKVYVVGEQAQGMPTQYGNFMLLSRRDGAQDLIQSYLNKIKPHYFVWLEDTFTMTNQGVKDLKIPDETKFVVYVPQDGDMIPTTGHEALKKADIIVPMAQWSKEITEREGFKCTEPIYHGVDFNLYTPASTDEKKKLRKQVGLEEDDFIVLYVGRNSPRKLIQSWCDVIAKANKIEPKIKGLGHINLAFAINEHIPDYIERCIPIKMGDEFKGLLNKVIHLNPRAQSIMIGMSEQEMPILYKVADVYFSTAIGEGFGMPLTEAMSCGIPVIATDFTTTKELILNEPPGKRGIGVKYDTIWTGSFNVGHAIVSQDAAIEALLKLYKDSKLRKEMGRNGRAFIKEKCDWNKIVNQWEKLFKDNLNMEKIKDDEEENKSS